MRSQTDSVLTSVVFLVGCEHFTLDVDPSESFRRLRRRLSRDLSLHCSFTISAGDADVRDDQTPGDFPECTEFLITRAPRPRGTSGWTVNLSSFVRVKGNVFRDAATENEVFVRTFRDDAEFRRQLQALMDMDHPGVVPLFGCVPDERTVVTRFLQGGSLADVLEKEQPWWDGTAKSIVVGGIVLAMIEAHRLGVVHRDLRPDNILLDELHRPRICEFGRDAQRSVYTAGDDQPGMSSDVYAFAMILLEVVVGEKEFVMKRENDVKERLPAHATESVRRIIERALTTEPANRGSFERICDELRRDRYCIVTRGCDPEQIEAYLDWVSRCRVTERD
jgi:tRNA A-37 threonylcarbamoyl transferase component Bud32